MTDTQVADHPAKWNPGVLYAMSDVLACEVARRGQLGTAGVVLDPFAGVGRNRLADVLGDYAAEVVGVELQPEWGDDATVVGDATDLPADWSGRFNVVATSPCYGNRMADHHDATDLCKGCDGSGRYQEPGLKEIQCPTCKGLGLSWRNTYAHALRRQGGELVLGSAAGLQWGYAYRDLHKLAIMEMVRCTVEGGLLLVNMSNHVRNGVEQQVVEWWLNELLHKGCSIVEVRRVPTRRQRQGANGDQRVDGEVVIAMRTPTERRLL